MRYTVSMRSLCCLPLLLIGIGFAGCSVDRVTHRPVSTTATRSVIVDRVDYKGWPGAWRLRSQSCELIVLPAISRVMHLSTPGGPNLLWENPTLAGQTFPADDGTWHNIGGEKLWPTQQKDLFKKYTGHDGWPPPWPWDAGASVAEPIAGGVRLTLPHDSRFGAHAVREFTLDPEKPIVHVRQWIEKTEGEPAEMTVWTVCQVNNPLLSLIPSADGKYADFGTHSDLMMAKAGYATVGRDEKQGLKIGIAASGQNGWVASVFADGPTNRVMLVQSHKLQADAKYPDDGLQAELYTSPKDFAFYTEMELLSPLVKMKAGARLEDYAIWQLVPVNGSDPAAIARRAHEEALRAIGPAGEK